MICSVGDKRLKVGLLLAGIRNHYDSVDCIKEEDIIITTSAFFDINRKEFEQLERIGKVIIKYMGQEIEDVNVRDLV